VLAVGGRSRRHAATSHRRDFASRDASLPSARASGERGVVREGILFDTFTCTPLKKQCIPVLPLKKLFALMRHQPKFFSLYVILSKLHPFSTNAPDSILL
jgi:hypothetical protein